MDWLGTIFGGEGGVGSVVKSVGDAVGQFVDKPEDKLKLQQAMAEADLAVRKLAFDAQTSYMQDRASARELYSKDNSVQKVYALTFLIGYVVITLALLIVVVGWIGAAGVVIPDWASLLIGTIFGAMSQKVGTVTDFYFGSSQSSSEKNDQIQSAMSRIPKS
jgi:hypothetical protein